MRMRRCRSSSPRPPLYSPKRCRKCKCRCICSPSYDPCCRPTRRVRSSSPTRRTRPSLSPACCDPCSPCDPCDPCDPCYRCPRRKFSPCFSKKYSSLFCDSLEGLVKKSCLRSCSPCKTYVRRSPPSSYPRVCKNSCYPCFPRKIEPCFPRPVDPCIRRSCKPCFPKPCDPCFPKPCDPCFPKPCDPCLPKYCDPYLPKKKCDPCLSKYCDPCLPKYRDPCLSKYCDPCFPKYRDPCLSKYCDPCSPKYCDPCSPKYRNPCLSKYCDPCSPKNCDPCSPKYCDPCLPKSCDPCFPKSCDPCISSSSDPCCTIVSSCLPLARCGVCPAGKCLCFKRLNRDSITCPIKERTIKNGVIESARTTLTDIPSEAYDSTSSKYRSCCKSTNASEITKLTLSADVEETGPSLNFLEKFNKLNCTSRFEPHLCPWQADIAVSGTVRAHCNSTAVEIIKRLRGKFQSEGERYTTDSCCKEPLGSSRSSKDPQRMSLGELADGGTLDFSKNNQDPDQESQSQLQKGTRKGTQKGIMLNRNKNGYVEPEDGGRHGYSPAVRHRRFGNESTLCADRRTQPPLYEHVIPKNDSVRENFSNHTRKNYKEVYNESKMCGESSRTSDYRAGQHNSPSCRSRDRFYESRASPERDGTGSETGNFRTASERSTSSRSQLGDNMTRDVQQFLCTRKSKRFYSNLREREKEDPRDMESHDPRGRESHDTRACARSSHDTEEAFPTSRRPSRTGTPARGTPACGTSCDPEGDTKKSCCRTPEVGLEHLFFTRKKERDGNHVTDKTGTKTPRGLETARQHVKKRVSYDSSDA